MEGGMTEIFGVTITAWKLIGYLGVAMFTGRWFVQVRDFPTYSRSRSPCTTCGCVVSPAGASNGRQMPSNLDQPTALLARSDNGKIRRGP